MCRVCDWSSDGCSSDLTDAAHELTPSQTARILVEALPYVRRFAGKSGIVKLGGAAIDKALDRALAQDVLLLRSVGVRCVVVHGGGPQVNGVMERIDRKSTRLNSSH